MLRLLVRNAVIFIITAYFFRCSVTLLHATLSRSSFLEVLMMQLAKEITVLLLGRNELRPV